MQLTTKSKRLLDDVATVMSENPHYHYNIQGHTDNRGKDEYNLKLSAKRARKVKEYLVLKGVDSNILTTEGLGSLQPIASNDTKEGRLLNRRVVFEIIK
jgi:outer membrane protein OmpA-like peptidoglycan-associated protein